MGLFTKFKSYIAVLVLVLSFSTGCFAQTSENAELKIVQLTDVHYDEASQNIGARLYKDSPKLFESAINEINSNEDIDAVVFSGDCINLPFKNNLNGFLKLAKTLKHPWYATVGNHDVRFGGEVSKDLFFKNMSENNSDMPKLENITYYDAKPIKGYKMLFLDAVITDRVTALGYFPEEELKWLDKELSDSPDDKFILVQHHPVVPGIKSTDHYVLNAEQYLNVIDKHKNVVAVMSGHYHCTRVTERNNVLHISTPALVQYPNAYRIITFKDNGTSISVSSKFKETELKTLQQISRENTPEQTLPFFYGRECDRNFSFKLLK